MHTSPRYISWKFMKYPQTNSPFACFGQWGQWIGIILWGSDLLKGPCFRCSQPANAVPPRQKTVGNGWKLENKVGQRTQKQDDTQHAFSWKSCGVASCALHEIDVRSLLKHRAHWWYQGPRFTTACCVSYAYSLLVAISVNVINSIPSV